MDDDERRFADFLSKLDLIEKRLQETSPNDPFLLEVFESFNTALEELHISSEELRVKNEELRESRLLIDKERLHYLKLFDFAPDIYVVTDLDANIQEVNLAAGVLARKRSMIGKPLLVYIAQEDHKAFLKLLFDQKISHKELECELMMSPHAGTPFPASLKVATLADPHGKPYGLIWLVRNIEEQKRAEADHFEVEKQRLLNNYNRNLIEASLDPLVTISPDGKITDVNNATERITGLARQELIGTDFSEYFTEPQRARAGYRLAFEQGVVRDYELELRHHDGHITPVLYNASVFRDENGQVVGVFAAARDITDRKDVEKQLRLSNAYNRNLIEVSLDPLVTISPDGKITDVNNATERVTGLSRKELIGTDFREYFTDPQRARAGYQLAFEYEVVRDYELELCHRDGHTVPVLYNASVFRDENGQVVGVFAAARDMTDHLRAEEQLRLQTAALESAPNGIFITDDKGNIQWANPAFQAMTGYKQEEVLGQNPRFLKSSRQDNEYYRNMWETILSGHVWRGELINCRKGGMEYFEEQTIAPVFGKDGKVTHFVAVMQDITSRKRAEDQIREEASRAQILAEVSRALSEGGPDYQEVIRRTPRQVAVLSGDICALYMVNDEDQSPELATIFSPEQNPISEDLKFALNQLSESVASQVIDSGEQASLLDLDVDHLDALLTPEDASIIKKCGISGLYAVPLRVAGSIIGSLVLFRCRSQAPWSAADQLLLQNLADRAALAINNTYLYADLKRSLEAEQSLRNQIVQAEKFSAVGRMVASIAHEMNNPLQTVKNCLYLIRKELPQGNDSSYLDMASSEVQRISRLVAQLREIYRPRTSGKLQPIQISQVLDDVSALIESHLLREHVVLDRPVEEDSFTVAAVSDQLKQVFLNISLNAIEAMQPDGGTLTISVKGTPQDSLVGIRFQDTGTGISPDIMSKLFQPLFTTKEFGLGLGLSISNDIVKRLGGRIDVESQLGTGSTFTVWLPAAHELLENGTPEE